MDLEVVEQVRNELYCPHCTKLLKDAVQTESGTRLCEHCFNEVLSYPEKKCANCKVDLKEGSENPLNPQCQKDRAIRKEILGIAVYCKGKNDGCSWKGKLQDYEMHSRVCEYVFVECPNGCGAKLKLEDQNAHADNECPEREVECDFCQKKSPHRAMEQHVLQCPLALVKCEVCGNNMPRSKIAEHETSECKLVECCVCNKKVDRSTFGHLDDPKTLFNHIQTIAKKQIEIEHKLDRTVSQMTELKEIKSSNELDHELEVLVTKKIQERLSVIGIHARSEPFMTSSFSLEKEKERKLEEVDKSNQLLKVRVSELELQLQASLASTHNGAFLWRIPDIARRKRDAIDERITSIYSPPFYTGRNGYKMCIRAYLNGDGIGYKTHLSIFFVLMKGEYDPLLKWPFDHKVSLILVDQNHRKHIVQTFKPTQESSSFQRPRSDMNVASGCPQFSKLDVLEDPSYVKDDVMYIKCIVDTSRIFHP